jgi:hypothetical protein
MADPSDREHSAESRRILDQVERESKRGGYFALDALPGRARDHLKAADADQSDRIEVWGTRIGRMLGPIVIVALVFWALSLLAAGA